MIDTLDGGWATATRARSLARGAYEAYKAMDGRPEDQNPLKNRIRLGDCDVCLHSDIFSYGYTERSVGDGTQELVEVSPMKSSIGN